jgi:hypothetical protein
MVQPAEMTMWASGLIVAMLRVEGAMHIELSRDEAAALRDLLQHRVTELDKEINRTDSLEFKSRLQGLDRTIERVLGRVATALEQDVQTSEGLP